MTMLNLPQEHLCVTLWYTIFDHAEIGWRPPGDFRGRVGPASHWPRIGRLGIGDIRDSMGARSGQNLLGDGVGAVDDRYVSVGGWGRPVALLEQLWMVI
jgi:hypothetical protein